MADKAIAEPAQLTVEDAPGASREIRRIITIAKRTLMQWRVFAVAMTLGVLAAGTVIVLRKPSYRSESVVHYKEGIRGSYLGNESGTRMRTLGTRLKEMLMARPQLEVMVDEFGLYQKTKEKEGYVAAVDEFRKDIQFKARALDTFWISYKGKSPEQVQQVTARLADSLIQENARLGIEQAKVQSEFMSAARQQSVEGLKTKERDLARFLATHPEFALDSAVAAGGAAQGATIRAAAAKEQSLGGLDAGLAGLQRQAARIRVTLETGNLTTPEVAAADPALVAAEQQAAGRVSSAQAELAQARSRFTDAHPDVSLAKNKVAKAQSGLTKAKAATQASKAAAQSAIEGTYDSPEVKRQKLKKQLRDLEAQIAARKGAGTKGEDDDSAEVASAASRVVALETQWARLNREAADARERVDDLERKAFRAQLEASSALGGYGATISVIDPAFKPTRPNPPGKTLIMLMGLAAAFAIALVISLIRALLDDRIYDVNDLARISPVLAVVPRVATKRWWKRG